MSTARLPASDLLSRALPLLLLCGGVGCGDEGLLSPAGPSTPPVEVVTDSRIDGPLVKATPAELSRFAEGDALFDVSFRPADGLGPLYIRAACASCHAEGANGPGVVQKMGLPPEGTKVVEDEALFPFGHTVRPLTVGEAVTPLLPPSSPLVVTGLRIGAPVFGRGYLEAIADEEIERVERTQAESGHVSGRIHRVRFGSEANPGQPYHSHTKGEAGLIGRFGFKARVATLDDFSADAFQGDMGMTSPLRPAELPNPDGLSDDGRPGHDVTLEGVNAVSDYVRLIEIPVRPLDEARARSGAALFERVGCASCHVPSLRTRADYPIAALAGIDAPVFTDLLLHDMGEGLADGLSDGAAEAREWRTAPLMGIRLLRSYLHDGRATTVEEAVLFHDSPGSEASSSVSRFRALTDAERHELLEYVHSL